MLCRFHYLNIEIDKETMIEKAIIATRQLCKRQSTWLKGEKDTLQLDDADIDKALKFILQQPA